MTCQPDIFTPMMRKVDNVYVISIRQGRLRLVRRYAKLLPMLVERPDRNRKRLRDRVLLVVAIRPPVI